MNDRITQIEQVRELMFGPQIRECNLRVERLELLVAQSQDQIQKRFDEICELLSSEVNTAAVASDKKIRALDLKTGEECAELRARVEQLEEKSNTRLHALTTELTTFQEEVRKRLESLHDSFSGSLNGAVEVSDKRFQALTADLQEQGVDLRKQTKRTEEKFEVRLQSLSEEIESGMADLRGQLTQTQKGIHERLQLLKTQLSDHFHRQLNETNDSKVSKDEISQILVEFGMRIKGQGFNPGVALLPMEVSGKQRV
ncbi:MAG: hypothetical protein ACU843_12305 [Gammaproteobacteria bacterium]